MSLFYRLKTILIEKSLKKDKAQLSVEKTVSAAIERSENALATHRSNVNEYLLATHLARLANHEDVRPGSTEKEKQEAEARYLQSKAKISPEEHEHQDQRAYHMAQAAHSSYMDRGINLKKATSFHITAGKGAIKKLTGLDVRSEDNTSDVVARIPGKKGAPDHFPGISAKSNKENTEGKGTERISNPGLGPVATHFGKDWHEDAANQMHEFAMNKGIDWLPMDSKSEEKPGRKQFLRQTGNEQHERDSREQGAKLQRQIRDAHHNTLHELGSNPKNTKGVEKVRSYLLDTHFRTGVENHPTTPHIVVSGYGNRPGEYSAHTHSSEDNPHVEAIKNATHFSVEHSGDTGTNIYAHTKEYPEGLQVLKTQTKWNSQPMVSSIKMVGTEGNLKPKKIKKMDIATSKTSTIKPIKSQSRPVVA